MRENKSDKIINKKRIAKNTLFMYFRTFLVMLITLYTSRVVLMVLGEVNYGIYSLIAGFVLFFSFMNFAMSTAVQRYLNFYLGRGELLNVQKVFSMSIITHLIIVLIVLIFGATIGFWVVKTQLNIPLERETAAVWVYCFSLGSCCINIIRIPYDATIIAYEKMKFYAYLSIIEVILKLLIVYLLLVLSADVLILYSALIFLVSLFVFFLYKIYCNRIFEITKVVWFWNSGLFSKLISFSGWSLFGSIGNVSVNQGLSILLNLFHGVGLNATLGIAQQIQAAMATFISSFQTAFSPQIMKSYAANDFESFEDLVFRSSRLSYCLVFVFAIPLMVCISPILNLWLTQVPVYTASFSIMLIICCMIDALAGPLWVSVQAIGNIKRYQLEITFLLLLNLPFSYLVLFCGFDPVLTMLIRALLNFIAYLYRIIFLSKYFAFRGMKYFKEVTLPVFMMTACSVPLALLLSRYDTCTVYAFVIFIFLVLFDLILVFIFGLKKNERQLIFSFIRKATGLKLRNS